MGFDLGTAWIRVKADLTGVRDTIARAADPAGDIGGKAGKEFGGEFQKQAERPINGLHAAFQNLKTEGVKGVAAGIAAAASFQAWNLAAGAIRGVVSTIGDAVKDASALEESMSKVNVVFGDGADEVVKWAESSSTAFGQSQQQALEAAGTYGNLFQAFGVARSAATEMSTSLVELAADLASFNNTSVDDALLALRSGLSGETEPLKRYGIAISDARLRTALMAKGVKNLGGTLTPLQKSTAAYTLIMQDSALAQGDFARTSDGLANSQRILDAQLKDLSTEFGKVLMPIITSGVNFLVKTGIPAIRDIATQIGEVAAAASEAARPVAEFFDSLTPEEGFDLKKFLPSGGLFAMVDDAKATAQALIDLQNTSVDTTKWLADERAKLASSLVVDPDVLEDFSGAFVAIAKVTSEMVEEEGRRLPHHFADGILKARQAPLDAFEVMKKLMKESLSETAQTTRLLGQLASEELAKGITDKDPAVRNAAREARNLIINQLEDLGVTPGTLTKAGMDALVLAMKSKDPIVAEAAKSIYNSVKGAIPTTAEATSWGDAFMTAYAASVSAAEWKVRSAAAKATAGIRDEMMANSPPGPKSTLHNIDKWGYSVGRTWSEHFADGIRHSFGPLEQSLGALSLTPSAGLPTMASPAVSAAAGSGTGSTPARWVAPAASRGAINVTVNYPAPEPASQSVEERLRILAATGII